MTASFVRTTLGGPALLVRASPLVFVVIWATGFIVARLVASHAEPLTFLSIRFSLGAAAFAVISLATGATWPRTARAWGGALLTGMLMQGVFLGGVFWATRHGLPAAVTALITGLQPLATGILAYPVLRERVTGRRWIGIVLGFLGAMLVVAPSLSTATAAGLLFLPVLACVLSMLSMTAGTLIQKSLRPGADLRTHACGQFIGGAALVIPLALLTEDGGFDGSWQAWTGMVWAVLALSVGAASLLLALIRRGAVAGVAALFYLVPPVVGLMAWALFDERLSAVQGAGMLVAAAGVFVASRG